MTPLQMVDWDQLLLVFMHDPIDKTLDLWDHESRAARYASAALGREVGWSEIESTAGLADQLASIAERLPMPTAGRERVRAVLPVHGMLQMRHPVSGELREIKCGTIDEAKVIKAIVGVIDNLTTPRERFLALWRLLPERLDEDEAFGGWLTQLPADTRVPDHSLVDHADISAGIWASRQGAHGGAYLSCALGPVQPFIEAARSVRDLWTGSAILSWLSFEAMRPIVEFLGPTSLIFPSLRGNPLMDLWLRKTAKLDCVPLPKREARTTPSLPHRFVAVVPWGLDGVAAGQLAERCEAAARAAWARLADNVHERLNPVLQALSSDWDGLWLSQVGDFFDIQTTVVPERALDDDTMARLTDGRPFDDAWPDGASIRGLSSAIPSQDRPGYAQDAVGRWQAQLDLSARVMNANREIRHVPTSQDLEDANAGMPPKCSLFGSWEQMGPWEFKRSEQFWEDASQRLRIDGVRLRRGERFCAVALAKRFGGPAVLADELDLDPTPLRFPDTATVAAAEWLKDAGIDPEAVRSEHEQWSGRWLHGPASESEDERAPEDVMKRIANAALTSRPPSYFAVLMMDGDDIGGWLRGDNSPVLRDVMHRKMRDYFEGIGGPKIEAALAARRPVGPALHASISAALGDFAARVAPEIVRQHAGTVIYSGGDDLLALLPAARAVACADALRRGFRGETAGDARPAKSMGNRATVSAGIAYVHHMEDLRLCLQAAREAEKCAKTDGKDTLHLHFMRRSGEHAGAVLPWPLAGWFADLVALFAEGASDRWAYRLRSELPVLAARDLQGKAVAAEIRRLGNRIDDPKWRNRAERPGDLIECWWRDYRDHRAGREAHAGDALVSFVTLCQGAAFVARSRDG